MSVNSLINDIQFFFFYKDIKKNISYTGTRINRNMQPIEVSYDFGVYNKYIDKFISRFKEVCTEEQLNNLYHKLSTLKIEERVEEHIPKFTTKVSAGYYDSINNVIVMEYYKDRKYSEDEIEKLIFHELIHMASSRKIHTEPEDVICGFEIPYLFGKGLNESYADYVNNVVFRKKEYFDTEDYFMIFMKGLENVVGADKLRNYFFNSDLNSLVEDLSQYGSRKEVIRMLFLLDKMRENPFPDRRDNTLMIRFIAKLNRVKLEKEYDSGKLSDRGFQIQYALKVSEYKLARIWPDDTEFMGDDNCFMFRYKDQESEIYPYITKEDKKYIKID